MTKRFRHTMLGWIAAAFAWGGFAIAPTQAALILTIDDLSTAGPADVSVTDGGVGDQSPLAGVLLFNGGVGSFIVNVTTGVSKPVLTCNPTLFDLNSVNVTGASGGSLLITLSDTGFLSALPNVGFSSNIGGTTNGTVDWKAYVDPTNVGTSAGATIIGQGIFSDGPFSATGSVGAVNVPLGTYALLQVVTITHTAGGQISSFDAETQVPEPGILGLLGVGLVGLGAMLRRRRTT